MPLDEQSERTIRNHLRNLFADCPMCGARLFRPQALLKLQASAAAEEGQKVVSILCDSCGHIALFAAARFGF